jgi:hypothetical protein
MTLKRALWIMLIFAACIAVQWWLERTHRVDSIGVWYTLYSAAIHSVCILIALFVFRALWRVTRRWLS